MIAKNKLYVSNEELCRLFNLPEGVEIMSVEKSTKIIEGYEFMIVSADEIVANDIKVTVKNINFNDVRQLRIRTFDKSGILKEDFTDSVREIIREEKINEDRRLKLAVAKALNKMDRQI